MRQSGSTAALAIAVSLVFSSAANAQDAEAIEYRIEAGDTLYELAQDYFSGNNAIAEVQRLNRISNARRLRIGSVIRVPRSLLKYREIPLRVLSFSGPVSIHAGSQVVTPTVGAELSEGALVSTGARGFISIGGEGNSRLSLPSNSRVRINGARRYLIDDTVDFDLRVLRGRGDIVAPKLKKGERFRVGTPVAVTAVRGTEFRIGFDEDASLALTEVTEGLVEVSAEGSSTEAPAGTGVASNRDGIGSPEALLSAPEIVDPGAIQTGETVNFEVEPITGASGYRTQIARDAGFIEVIAETVSGADDAVFAEIADGRLFVRSRAIAQSGLEGFSKVYSFRRKQVGVSAAVEPAPFDDAFKFAWRPEGSGQSFAAFQLWPAAKPETLLVDEVGLDFEGFYIGDIAPGVYKWRVATFQIDEGDVIKVWGPEQELTITE